MIFRLRMFTGGSLHEKTHHALSGHEHTQDVDPETETTTEALFWEKSAGGRIKDLFPPRAANVERSKHLFAT